MLELFTDGFRITALFLLLVFSVVILLLEAHSFKRKILLFFLITTAGYLLAYWDLVQMNVALFQVTFFFSVLFPISFWLVSKALFDDDFSWNNKYWILTVSVSVTHYLLYKFNELYGDTLYRKLRFLPYMISVIFILMVIYESLKNKENDLVLSRLQKRNIFAVFSSFIALVSLYYFFVGNPLRLPTNFVLLQNIFVSLFIILFFSDQFQFKNLFVVQSNINYRKQKKGDSLIQNRIIEKLDTVFKEEKLFCTEGITISKLADIINEKEYQIRRTINQQLGYTNFNSYLNHYRIQEARRLINENHYKALTFQEIAFRMGYQSVATFNRAFKNETGKTPGEYANQEESQLTSIHPS